MSLLVLAALLVLPALAVHGSPWPGHWMAGYAITISALSYWLYAVDKRRAKTGEWRVPEARLHVADLLGGWPGGFMAQRQLRHKCSKRSFQIAFWLIVLLWQLVAVDSLRGWVLSKAAGNWIERSGVVDRGSH